MVAIESDDYILSNWIASKNEILQNYIRFLERKKWKLRKVLQTSIIEQFFDLSNTRNLNDCSAIF